MLSVFALKKYFKEVESMVSFTVEEALANLKDPLHPQFIKKDMEEEQNSTEGTNSFGGGA